MGVVMDVYFYGFECEDAEWQHADGNDKYCLTE